MAIIEKPLNVFEIANQLGYYEFAPHPVTGVTVRKVDVGRLCTHPNINKWSKYKPVRFNKVGELTEIEKKSAFYGVKIQNANSPIALFNKVIADGYTHIYEKPRGNSSEPFRISDFNGYVKDGGSIPTSTGENDSKKIGIGNAIDNNKSVIMQVIGGLEPIESDYLLWKGDLYPSSAIHRGILLIKGANSRWITGNVDWNEQPLKNWLGEVTAFQFFTNKAQLTLRDGDSVDAGSVFYAVTEEENQLVNINPYTITVDSSYSESSIKYNVTITAMHNNVTNKVTYSVSFKSTSPETTGGTLSNVVVELTENGVVKGTDILGNYTLPNNSEKTYTGSFNQVNENGLIVKVFEGQTERASTNVLLSPPIHQ